MHEYHIVDGIVKQAIETAKNNGAKKVTRITLVMGELSGLQESSVRLYFENLSKGTLLEGAEIIINPAKAKLRCNTCDMVFDYKRGEFDCPHCGNMGIRTDKMGKEFYIEDIEIES